MPSTLIDIHPFEGISSVDDMDITLEILVTNSDDDCY